MTARAYVLVEVTVGKTKEIVASLQKVKGLKSVDAVTGPYDMIAVVEGPDLTSVGNLVSNKIHTVSGVIRTVTCLVVELN